jgi:DNA (cytosine-5)-methyltransferase 1
LIAHSLNAHPSRSEEDNETFVVETVGASHGQPKMDGVPLLRTSLGVRRLTPRECERLMGFPDDHTLIPYRGAPARDSPRYRALGNSMVVPVMAWIGRRVSSRLGGQ